MGRKVHESQREKTHMARLGVFGIAILMGGIALADTVVENGGAPIFTNMPSNLSAGLNSGVPYWDNNSGDGSQKNVGYFLTGSGGFSGGTNYNPQGYLSQPGNPDQPSSFNLVRDTNSLVITLLALNTGDLSAVFGYYDASKTNFAAAQATEHPLFTSGSSAPGTATVNLAAALSGSGISTYGFYLAKCANYPSCSQTDTFFSNAAIDNAPGDSALHQHFALFNYAADAKVFYLGAEDWFGATEGLGDYNDMTFKISSDAVPEPATLAMIGSGLLGLGYTRSRSRRKSAV
jgi:hypothetical protein